MRKLFPLLLLATMACSMRGQTQDECLRFLYASMPLPDSIDYSRKFYIDNINSTLKAREEMMWGRSIPEREFMHFVLPVRVNNENMDESRMVFYKELKDRVKGMSMKDAILEVNHWCHEKVTYTPSDERTSSPLASIRTAYGRCGEESTLLVAALRSVCIPARQVYTPRWAHTDDNHAWVEAWADGEWYFLGACEPEAVLNLGWFNAPASRGMLMHTKAFGNYDGPEEVMQRTPCYTEIDVTANYAPITKRQVRVVDSNGNTVEGATVEFKIYNYAEFYTVAKKQTDKDGMTYMQAGRGDLMAWAYKEGKYGFAKCSMTDSSILTIALSHSAGERYSEELTIVPPTERNTVPYMTEEQRTVNAARLVREDSIRNAYVATFPNAQNDDILKAARGNYKCIETFRSLVSNQELASALLRNISEKDLRDVSLDVLMDNIENATSRCDSHLYNKYVLSPRVANEMLTPYKGYLLKAMSKRQKAQMAKGPKAVAKWVEKNIRIDKEHNPQALRMTPIGVWNSRLTDETSRNIFFVAMCRTLGFPARIDAVTGKTEYADEKNEWVEVKFGRNDDKSFVAKGWMQVTYSPNEYILNPKYYSHFTLSQIKDGSPQLLNYDENDTWESTLAKSTQLDEGDYLLTSGTRMADGSVLVRMEVVPVAKEQTTTLSLSMPNPKEGLKVIGNFNSENLYNDETNGMKSILSTTGRGFYLLGIIAPNNEPSNHTLRDIAALKSEFEELDVKTILLFEDEEAKSRFNKSDFPELPANTYIGTDIDKNIWNEISTNMHLSSHTLPVFIIADTFNRIVYISQGYTIGIGERIAKNFRMLRVKD